MKRLMDLGLVLFLAPLWLPFLLGTAVLVRLKLGRPVFFRQRRAGLDGKPFDIIKFRTMRDLPGPGGRPLPDELRLTPFGQRLRRLSLDEVPEILNIIQGEMSFVGPRPLPIAYLPRYTKEQVRRHACRPGITGWAQVHGRNRVDWERRFQLDLWYVDHRSVWLDFRILWKTVGTVLRREGISGPGSPTMPEFKGTPPLAGEGHRSPGKTPRSEDPSRKSE